VEEVKNKKEIKNTIAMLNMKGGVSKTTLAVNVAGALAKLWNYRILLVDLDPQYNATQYLVNVKEFPEYVNGKEPTILDVMGGAVESRSVIDGRTIGGKREPRIDDLARNLYQSKKGEGRLDLIPSTLHLINVEGQGFGKEHLLQNFINKVKPKYDLIIIDCPPTFSVFLLSGYLASDYYLVPLKPDPLSTLGITLLEQVLDAYAPTYEKSIEPLGVVFTMVRETREMSNVMDTVESTSVGKRYIFRNSLSFSTYVAEASRKNTFLFEYAKSWKQGEEISQITKELIRLLPE
jgi:chromosome partitioning protein